MMENLPDGWSETTLDKIANWGSGGTPSRKNSNYYKGNIPWIKTGDLGGRIVYEANEFISEDAVKNSSAKLFKKNSVILAMYGATIGKTSILGIDATTNQACAVGQPNSATSTDFLYYLICSEKNNFIAKGKGGAQPNISQAIIKDHKIRLPSLAEQNQIARLLDQHLAQVEQIKTRLAAIPILLKKFRQSVLADAISGKLTEGKYDSLWIESSIDQEFKCIDGDRGANYPKKEEYQSEGHCLFLSTKNVRQYGFSFNNLVFLSKEKHDVLRGGTLQRGDMIITTRGTLGYIASYDDSVKFDVVRINSGMLILRKKKAILINSYVMLYLASPDFQRIIEEQKTGSAQPQLPAKILKSFKIQIPPLEEQSEIVRCVEQLFSHADFIEQRVMNAQKRVNNLTQSILTKAFSGELTAAWREQNLDLISGENSAAKLLERIQLEREAAGNKAKKIKGVKA